MRDLILLFGLFGLFLGWNAPNHYPPWTAFHLEFFAAIGACLIGAAVLMCKPAVRLLREDAGQAVAAPMFRLPVPLSARLWMLAALVPVFQYFTGNLAFRGDAVIGLLYGLGVGLCIYTGSLWAEQQGSARALRCLCLTVVVAGLAANGVALGQWLRLDTPGWWAMELIDDRPYASLGQPNHFGLLMVMAVVAVTALFEAGAVKSRAVYGLAVAYFGWGVHISQSRASALALMAVVALWLLTRKRVTTRLQLTFVLPAAVAWCGLALGMSPVQETLLLAPAELRAPTEVGARQAIWLHFWEAVLQRPWTGYGFNQGVLALSEVADRVQPSRNVVFAHSVVLDLMAWVGMPLALAFMAAIGGWMGGWLRRQADPVFMAERHVVFAIWLVLLVQSLLEFPYAHTYFLLPAALMAGAVTRVTVPLAVPSVTPRVGASPAALGLAAATAAVLGLLGWEYFQIESDFRSRRFERANFSTPVERSAPSEPLILDQLAALNASSGVVIQSGMSAQQLQKMGLLARRFHILSTRLDYAKALAMNGQAEQAEREIVIIRSAFDTWRGARIEREWRHWLAARQTASEQAPPQAAPQPKR